MKTAAARVDQGDGFSGLWPLGRGTMPRRCAICGKEGANHATPNGAVVHLSCGKLKWRKELEKSGAHRSRR